MRKNTAEAHAAPWAFAYLQTLIVVGTTRSRVNVFMNKFRKLGFIEYNGGLTIHDSLLSIVLRDEPQSTADRRLVVMQT